MGQRWKRMRWWVMGLFLLDGWGTVGMVWGLGGKNSPMSLFLYPYHLHILRVSATRDPKAGRRWRMWYGTDAKSSLRLSFRHSLKSYVSLHSWHPVRYGSLSLDSYSHWSSTLSEPYRVALAVPARSCLRRVRDRLRMTVPSSGSSTGDSCSVSFPIISPSIRRLRRS